MTNKSNFYAGIGSRETPIEMLSIMKQISETLYKKNFILRSGGADGADTYFELGAGDKKEIYIPWKGFNYSKSNLYNITDDAYKMAQRYHPRWNSLSNGARKLMARNCYQVLGQNLKTPVYFIICWTPNGGISGGTGQALRIARDFLIPVYNLQNGDTFNKITNYINKNKNYYDRYK